MSNNTKEVIAEKNYLELLQEKIKKEIEHFRDSYSKLDFKKAYDDYYKISFFESYYEMISTNFIDIECYENEIKWLSSKTEPLKFLYDEWLNCDDAFSFDWDEMLDFIESLHCEKVYF